MGRFPHFESARGCLGISSEVLLEVADDQFPVRINVIRTGRLYGSPASGFVGIQKGSLILEVPGEGLAAALG